MSRPDAPGEANGPAGEAAAPGARRVAQAVDAVIRLIPEGSNRAILAALATLAELGDAAALRAVEAHLAAAPKSVQSGSAQSPGMGATFVLKNVSAASASRTFAPRNAWPMLIQ